MLQKHQPPVRTGSIHGKHNGLIWLKLNKDKAINFLDQLTTSLTSTYNNTSCYHLHWRYWMEHLCRLEPNTNLMEKNRTTSKSEITFSGLSCGANDLCLRNTASIKRRVSPDLRSLTVKHRWFCVRNTTRDSQ